MDHKQRFMNWRKRMPEKTKYLVDKVLERIVPEFEKRGFVWYPDFAENNPQEIGANEIPLQKREGTEWPTVQIAFSRDKGPRFGIIFSALPEICKNPVRPVISREQAIVVYGPAYFDLRRGKWKNYLDAQFGAGFLLPTPSNLFRLSKYWLDWRKFFDSEVEVALALLPYMFETFDKKLYQEWLNRPFGYLNEHVFLLMSWKIRDDLERANQTNAA